MDLNKLVTKTAKGLDKHSPGWFNEVNLKIFNVGCVSNCVIGQSRFKWTEFPDPEEIGISEEEFYIVFGIHSNLNNEELQKHWTNKIKWRQNKFGDKK